jgi:zinc transport system permease protein
MKASIMTTTSMTINSSIIIPLVAGAAIALFAPVIGTFTVIRRYSLVADTLAHVSLLGIALGFVFTRYAGIMPFLVAVLAAIFLEYLREFKRVSGDSALAMLLTGGLAASVVVASAAGQVINEDVLFGSLESVTARDAFNIVAIGVVIAIVFALLWKEFVYTSFDEETARVQGVPVRFMNMFLMVIAALTVAFAIRVVGVLLVGALMVIPVNAALQLGSSFRATVFWSVIFSFISVVLGIFIAVAYGLNFGGIVVLLSFVCFLAAIAVRKMRRT